MTAREMFKALGYEYINQEDDDYFQYVKRYIMDSDHILHFGKWDKVYQSIGFIRLTKNHFPHNVEVEIHKAIHQQLKELGWL
jgi:hypothetical protein